MAVDAGSRPQCHPSCRRGYYRLSRCHGRHHRFSTSWPLPLLPSLAGQGGGEKEGGEEERGGGIEDLQIFKRGELMRGKGYGWLVWCQNPRPIFAVGYVKRLACENLFFIKVCLSPLKPITCESSFSPSGKKKGVSAKIIFSRGFN